ncbi:MAG: hypothetical protein ACRCXX_14130 [Cetobacterium sp.]|uniref:hypothetical protein n=1 Tax=Cetobacterium sp. TaxID=2071632 RepID=UPI003F32899C
MKIKNRIFEMGQDNLRAALQSFGDAHSDAKKFSVDKLKSTIKDEEGADTGIPAIIEVVNRIEDFASTIFNNGYDSQTQEHLTVNELNERMEDFLREASKTGLAHDFSVNTLGFVVQQTITRLVSMMEQPDLEAWMLVSKELVMAQGSVIYNVMVGVDGHATSRVAESGEYNTFRLESTEDYIKTNYGKVGIMASYSEEALRQAGVQAIKMLTDAALNDMKRFKSLEAIHLLESNARTYFDGLDPNKMPTGRSYFDPTKENGTLLMRDMEKFFASTQAQGFDVDVIFINPLAYAIFLHEPNVKAYIEKTAGVHFLVPKKRNTIAFNQFTRMTKVTSNTSRVKEGHEVIAPNLILNKSLNIIVTPIVKFHNMGEPIFVPSTRYTKNPIVQHEAAPNNCADVLLVDSSRALTYVHDGRGVMADTVENRLRDVTHIKFKSYYGFLLDKDHGVFAFRNINITDDVFDPIQKVNVTLQHSEIFPKP